MDLGIVLYNGLLGLCRLEVKNMENILDRPTYTCVMVYESSWTVVQYMFRGVDPSSSRLTDV